MRLNSTTTMSCNKLAMLAVAKYGYTRKSAFENANRCRHWQKHCRFPDNIKPFS
jgi:hypothetical protein